MTGSDKRFNFLLCRDIFFIVTLLVAKLKQSPAVAPISRDQSSTNCHS